MNDVYFVVVRKCSLTGVGFSPFPKKSVFQVLSPLPSINKHIQQSSFIKKKRDRQSAKSAGNGKY
jgi:hypothetical protein